MNHPLSLLLITGESYAAQALARSRPGWQVWHVPSLAEARTVLAGQPVDVVLAHHRLLDGSAFELLTDLQGRPAILGVGEGEEGVAAQGLRLGFADYLIADAGQRYLDILPLQVESAHAHAEAARELRENQQRLELAIEGSDLVPWDRHVVEGSTRISHRLALMLGYDPEDVQWDLGIWHELVHPDDWPRVQRTVKAYLDGETTRYECEYRMRHKSGEWLWLLSRARVVERSTSGAPLRLVGTFMDITERQQALQALRDSEARFRSFTTLSLDWYAEQDAQHRFTRLEGKFAVDIATVRQQLLGRTPWEAGGGGLSAAQWEAHRQVQLAHETFHDFELQHAEPGGQPQWVSVSGAPMFDDQGRFCGYRSIGRNITAQKQAQEETQRLAFYDTLTRLPNRRLLLDRLAQALVSSARSRHHGALLFIDLDNFKDLNDTRGHDVGDMLLAQVATRLAGCVRQGDTVARLGGDEFVIVLEDLSAATDDSVAQSERVAEKMLAELNRPYRLAGVEHYSTPSMGITLFGGQGHSMDELLKQADLAMYEAKAAGRNTIRFFDPDMQAAVTARAELELELRQALHGGELRLHYQPVVDEQGRLLGAEALVRWQHPQRGLVFPQTFIPLAEQTGLIEPLGQWVLRTACEQLVAWASHPATAWLTLAVNASARQFRQAHFVDEVLALLAETGARPHLLKIELTESMLLNDIEDTIAKMTALKARGVGFALDDFGTGYSSLAYLKRLPLDQLKIDKSFVRDILTDPNDAAIARTVVALAQSLGLGVVAEGVENQGQLAFLIAHGCRSFQGYLFGKPVPVAELPLGTWAAGRAVKPPATPP